VAATARDLIAALDRHYTGGAPSHRDADSHATWTELPDPDDHRIDYLSLCLWGNRGHHLDGHEIKVSRSDWLAELARPGKADTWWSVCHRWWLVVPHASIVADGELPDGWGLMVPTGRRHMKVITPAPVRSPAAPPWLTARLVKRERHAAAQRTMTEVRIARDEGAELARRQQEATPGAPMTSAMRDRLCLLDTLEHALGAPVRRWTDRGDNAIDPDTMVAALRIARAMHEGWPQFDRALDNTLAAVDTLARAATEVQAAHDALRVHTGAPPAGRSR
jgi:hypothetical protein